uniref:Uncharacterized protein n=1 Tax=Strongyloides venezuelensis TaxID=75913 RepID=A0A0K0FB94_STRVS
MRRYQFTQNLYYKISNKEIIYAISVGISQCSYGEIENCGLLLFKFFRTFNNVFDKIKKIDEHNSKKGTNSMKTTTSNENSADKGKKIKFKNSFSYYFNNRIVSEKVFTFMYSEQKES